MTTLLPVSECESSKAENQASNDGGAEDVTAGQLLCAGLFANDSLSTWLSSVALTHGMMDLDDLKADMLKVQVASAGDLKGPVSLLGNNL